jgi:hypothetical protein
MNVTRIPSLFEQLISETFNLTDYVNTLFTMQNSLEPAETLSDQFV